MPNKLPRYYWDSCVFVSLIEETKGRVGVIERLMEAAQRKEVEVYTSAVTIAEVAYHEREKADGALDPDVEQRISALWDPPSPVRLVEFHRLIAQDARGLIRSALGHSWGLKAMDAVHLATAQSLGVECVHTYDKKLHKYAELVGCKVEVPSLPNPDMFTALEEQEQEEPTEGEESYGGQ